MKKGSKGRNLRHRPVEPPPVNPGMSRDVRDPSVEPALQWNCQNQLALKWKPNIRSFIFARGKGLPQLTNKRSGARERSEDCRTRE